MIAVFVALAVGALFCLVFIHTELHRVADELERRNRLEERSLEEAEAWRRQLISLAHEAMKPQPMTTDEALAAIRARHNGA